MLLSNSSRNCPEGPTNGRPCLSSWNPGPSPIKSILACGLPSPGTAFVRPLQRSHLEQVETSAAISFSISSEDILSLPLFTKIGVMYIEDRKSTSLNSSHVKI